MIDLRTYWPNPAAGEQLIVQDRTQANGGGTFKNVLRRYVNRGTVDGNPVVRLDEFNHSGWLDAWEYRDDGSQILEVGTWQGAIHKVYKTGKEIPWGGVQNVGDMIERQLEVDVSKSTGVTPGYWNYGYQKITFTDFLPSFTNDGGLTFENVVKLSVFQSWCGAQGCAYPDGQNIATMDYWLAPGVGMIQIDSQAPTVRLNYASSIDTTWETP